MLHLICILTMSAMSYEVVIPHLTAGNASWGSLVQADNYSPDPQSFTLTLFVEYVEVYSENHEVEGMSKLTLNLSELAANGVCGVITYDSEQLQFRLSYESIMGGGLAEFALDDSISTVQTFRFSDFSSSVEWKGIAIANLWDQQAEGMLYALGDSGILGVANISIGPKTRIRGVHSSFFPNLTFNDINSFVLVTDLAVSGIAISGDQASSKLLFTQSAQLATFNTGSFNQFLGDWVGNWQSSQSPDDGGAATLTIQIQEGDQFTGVLDVLGTDCGDIVDLEVSGTVIDGVFDFKISFMCLVFPVEIHFFDGILNVTELSGQYEQTLNGEVSDKGTFLLNRQL